jgi:hypothetical protein
MRNQTTTLSPFNTIFFIPPPTEKNTPTKQKQIKNKQIYNHYLPKPLCINKFPMSLQIAKDGDREIAEVEAKGSDMDRSSTAVVTHLTKGNRVYVKLMDGNAATLQNGWRTMFTGKTEAYDEINKYLKLGICIATTQPFQAALGAESRVCYPGNAADRQTQ